MFWDNFSQKEKAGLLIGTTFMSLALLDRMIISPINSRIRQIDQQIKVSQKQLAMATRNVALKQSLSGEYKKYIPRKDHSRTDEESMALMLTAIEDLGHKAKVSLLDIKPQPTKSGELSKQYNVSVEAEGEMEALVRFLYTISRSPELLRVETLQLNLKDKDSKVIKASILISKIALP